MAVRKTTEQFIADAVAVHGDKYDYSKVNYVMWDIKIIINCPVHGDFTQIPNSHLSGKGCPKCGNLGKVKATKRRASNKKNWNFEQPEDYKLIPLTQGEYAKVDNEDFDMLKDINWCTTHYKYSQNHTVGLMHRLIMNAPEHLDVDHINHDTLDNRKSNLRVITRRDNVRYSRPRLGTSKYKGVSLKIHLKKWVSQIQHEGKLYYMGVYATEEEAGMAYDKKALELFGEFAYLNFPELKQEYLKNL